MKVLFLSSLAMGTMGYPPAFAGYFEDFPTEPVQRASPRFLLGSFPFPGGQTAMGTFTLDASKTPAWTVEGKIDFTQNIFSGQNSRYTAHLRGFGMEHNDYIIGMSDDCAGLNYKQLNQKITAPLFMVNGFYVKGLSTEYNVDKAGGKKDLNDYYMIVKSAAGDIIGCTTNKLA